MIGDLWMLCEWVWLERSEIRLLGRLCSASGEGITFEVVQVDDGVAALHGFVAVGLGGAGKEWWVGHSGI